MKFAIAALTLIVSAGSAAAQHQHGQSPYAGFQQRSIKALSDEQLADLRAGRGMGLALAGEMNGYPGPSHALELADRLALSNEQRQRIRELFDAMKVEAVSIGEKLIAQEGALDRAFAEKKISAPTLASMTAQIGETQGQLREVHLKYHLITADVLTPEQKHLYAMHRGYH
jgi:Spy/CpxP family protein refolding chaperone